MPPNDNNSNIEPVLPAQPMDMDAPPSMGPSTPSQFPPPAENPSAQSPAAPAPGEPVTVTYAPKRKFPIKIVAILLVILALLGIGGVILSQIGRLGQGGGGNAGEITWWGLWEDEAVVAPLIQEYQAQNPNVKITYRKQSPEDYRERLTSSLSQGNGPDIFRFHNSWTPMFRSFLDPMPTSVMSPSDFAQTYYPTIVSDLSVGANIVGMPLGFDTIALYINEDIFDTYLKTPPRTWDEAREIAKSLTIRDERGVITQSGASLGITSNVDHWPEIVALIGLQNNADLASPGNELMGDALDLYTRFATIDKVWDDLQPPSTVAFAQGKVAMYLGSSWRAHEIKKLNPNLRFKVVSVPQLPKEQETDPSTYYATYWAEGVWNESKSKQAAWGFLKFLSTPESLQKMYQNAASISPERTFGEPYPRMEMAGLLANDPVVGTFVIQAKEAKSWYLASRTFDGATGINTLLAKYFADAINSIVGGQRPQNVLTTLSNGVKEVLSQYVLGSTPQ